jgi:Flp pilus assembly pilin Flp
MDNWQPRGPRHKVRLDGSATRSNGSEVAAIVTNLSLDGCGLIGPFHAGERLSVKISGIGRLAAQIRWASMGRAGARFVTQTRKLCDNRGVAAIEYALIASLIALAVVAALTRLGGGVEAQYNTIDNAVPGGSRFDL